MPSTCDTPERLCPMRAEFLSIALVNKMQGAFMALQSVQMVKELLKFRLRYFLKLFYKSNKLVRFSKYVLYGVI